MKHVILLKICLFIALQLSAQDKTISGHVLALPDSTVLPGASVIIKGTTTGTVTNADGHFSLDVSNGSTLVFSFIGYASQEIDVSASTPKKLAVILQDDNLTLGEVEIYSTGYQELPAERATGSFEQIDNELINRSVSTDVISRLEGVTPGLLFDTKSNTAPGSASPKLRIRGLASMYGEGFSGITSSKEAPLVVVDNFPFAGEISDINPNDVERITVLKDAAAASIWGARAGNGVIVITTKQGVAGKTRIAFNSNVTIAATPDLHDHPAFLESGAFIDVERKLFEQGFYASDEANFFTKPVLSPAVELFIQQRDGDISTAEADTQLSRLSQYDIRDEAEKYLYRQQVNQQYALNVSGGNSKWQYYISGGYDNNRSAIVGNHNERVTFNSKATVRPIKKLQIRAGMYFSKTKIQDEGLSYDRLQLYNRLPYMQLIDDQGSPAAIPYGYRTAYIEQQTADYNLLDWHFYPLAELALTANNINRTENRINVGMDYELLPGLSVIGKYQYQQITGIRDQIADKETYWVRNLVNRFTQNDGTRIFPHEAIRTTYDNSTKAHNVRGQLSYDKDFLKHSISISTGAEIREIHNNQHSMQLYGYNDETLTYQSQFDFLTRHPVRPFGSSRIPTPAIYLEDYLDRFVSYYGLGAYTYQDKYTLSGSLRWDASNLFGVKTNQKGVPLWSVGAAWTVNNETFYNSTWLPMLKVRATFGYAGNIDKSATAYPTAAYGINNRTDLPDARLSSPGNPQLRWEKVRTANLGIDFSTKKNHVFGTLEYFQKKSTDLIAPVPLDPTTGFLDRFNVNYASLVINGFDLEVNTAFAIGPVQWKTTSWVSYAADKVEAFDEEVSGSLNAFTRSSTTLPVVGRPLYTLYSYPWIGLDPNTGDPLVSVEGQVGTDYEAYYNAIEPKEELVMHGPQVPPLFGGLRQHFSLKGFAISANFTWKTGYYFRRPALDYEQLYNNWRGHNEFNERWQQPGDEQHTHVPSMPDIPDADRERIYTLSELTVEKGNHIRLQDITFSYSVSAKRWSQLPVSRVKVYIYARNLGIIWKATNTQLDPDYPTSSYKPTRSLAMGVQVEF